VAAGILLVKEAGGFVCDFRGGDAVVARAEIDTVILNGAQTSTGLAVAQIAAAKGANVISVVCEGCADFKGASEVLKAAGSSVVIDQGSADSDAFKKACAELKPTLAIHCSPSASAATSIARALGPCGSIVSVAGAGPVTLPSSLLIDKGIMAKGFNLAAALSAKDAQQKVMSELLELIQGGKLKPTIAASESLAGFAKAVKAAGHSTGTVLLKM
jgi:NADPH:quinone reductase-like Zn-dependent oxidoreductase